MEHNSVAFDTLSHHQVSLLEAFAEYRVRYIIVGGFAVRYFGYLRYTQDLDILIEQTALNVDRVVAAFTQLGEVNSDKLAGKLLQPEKKIIWNYVELFSTMKGMQFSELSSQLQVSEFNGIELPLISLPDLIMSKQLALQASERESKWHIDEQDLHRLVAIHDRKVST
jgi:hypothetical protein